MGVHGGAAPIVDSPPSPGAEEGLADGEGDGRDGADEDVVRTVSEEPGKVVVTEEKTKKRPAAAAGKSKAKKAKKA